MTATRPTAIALVRNLLDVAIVGLVAVVLLAVILGRLVPLSGRQALIIAGPSMEPTLPLGSAVVVEPVAPGDVEVGDIVSVRNGERAIYTHRVVRSVTLQGEPYFETKGDNNPTADAATVPVDAVIGRVRAFFPLMGYVLAWLSVPSGVVSVLGIGAAMLVAALVLETIEADGRRRPRWLGLAPGILTDTASSSAARHGRRATHPRGKAALAARAAAVVPDADLAALVDRGPRRPELGTAPGPGRARPRSRPRRGSPTTRAAT